MPSPIFCVSTHPWTWQHLPSWYSWTDWAKVCKFQCSERYQELLMFRHFWEFMNISCVSNALIAHRHTYGSEYAYKPKMHRHVASRLAIISASSVYLIWGLRWILWHYPLLWISSPRSDVYFDHMKKALLLPLKEQWKWERYIIKPKATLNIGGGRQIRIQKFWSTSQSVIIQSQIRSQV